MLPQQDRLQLAALCHRRGERANLTLIEPRSWLIRLGLDLVDQRLEAMPESRLAADKVLGCLVDQGRRSAENGRRSSAAPAHLSPPALP